MELLELIQARLRTVQLLLHRFLSRYFHAQLFLQADVLLLDLGCCTLKYIYIIKQYARLWLLIVYRFSRNGDSFPKSILFPSVGGGFFNSFFAFMSYLMSSNMLDRRISFYEVYILILFLLLN
jgi:hypothetical protein